MYIDIVVLIFVAVVLATLAITLLLKLFELRDAYEALEDMRNGLREKDLEYRALKKKSAITESVIKVEAVSSQVLPVTARMIIPMDIALKGELNEEYIRARLIEQIAKSITDYVGFRVERDALEGVQYTASARILSKEE